LLSLDCSAKELVSLHSAISFDDTDIHLSNHFQAESDLEGSHLKWIGLFFGVDSNSLNV